MGELKVFSWQLIPKDMFKHLRFVTEGKSQEVSAAPGPERKDSTWKPKLSKINKKNQIVAFVIQLRALSGVAFVSVPCPCALRVRLVRDVVGRFFSG